MYFLWLSPASHSPLERVMDHLGIVCSMHPLCFEDIRHSYIQSLKCKHLPREPATALPFTKIRYLSPPTIVANFYWMVTVVRHLSELISSINSVKPLNNPSKKILLLLPFVRWVNWGTEDWITHSSSYRETGTLCKPGDLAPASLPTSPNFSLTLLTLPIISLLFTCKLCSSQSGLLHSSSNTFLFFYF